MHGPDQRNASDGDIPEAAYAIERPFLLGPDILTAETVILYPIDSTGKPTIREVPVTILSGDIPGLIVTERGWRGFSGRSRLAILGVTPLDMSWVDPDLITALQQGHAVRMNLSVASFASRPILIPENTGVGQYYQKGSKWLTGNALETAIKTGRIAIDGRWEYVHGDRSLGDRIAIQVPIDPDPATQRWLPPAEEPLEVPTCTYAEFRAILAQLLRPIHEVRPTHRFLAIRQTQGAIHIPDPNVTGLLSSGAVGHEAFGDQDMCVPQVNSVIIHGNGITDHPIILEHYVKPPDEDGKLSGVPNSVSLSFWDMG